MLLLCAAFLSLSFTVGVADQSSVNANVMLRFGNSTSEGVVYLDVWGMPGVDRKQYEAVCGDHFDDVDARVTCRELGFAEGRALCCDHYGPADQLGVTEHHVTNVTCTGSEVSLKDCALAKDMRQLLTCRTYAAVNCSGKVTPVADAKTETIDKPLTPAVEKDVSIDSSDKPARPNVELRFGDSVSEGVVFLDVWTMEGVNRAQLQAVCGDHFDDTDARVTCGELGYQYGRSLCCDYYGPPDQLGVTEHHVTNVTCTGHEQSLKQCSMSRDIRDLSDCRTYAAVKCSHSPLPRVIPPRTSPKPEADSSPLPPPRQRNVILQFGQSRADGVVYLQAHSMEGFEQFEPLCGTGFDQVDARVTCNELGYALGQPLCCNHYGTAKFLGISAHFATHVQCEGTERTLKDCPMSRDIQLLQACRSYAAVACSRPLPQDHQFLSQEVTSPKTSAGVVAGITISCIVVVVVVVAAVGGVLLWRRRKRGGGGGLPSYEMQNE